MSSFDELQELANLVQPNKIKNLVLFGVSEEPANKMDAFYRGLAKRELLNDKEAKELLYSHFPKHNSYNRLKDRLYDRLVNYLFLIDANKTKFNTNKDIYLHCLKQTLAIKIMLSSGARNTAVKLARKTFKIAEMYEYLDICLLLAKDLQHHYGAIVADEKKFNKYSKLVKKLLKLKKQELKAERYYTKLMIHFVKSGATQKEYVKASYKYVQKLAPLKKKPGSQRLMFLIYLIEVLHHEINTDYKNALKVAIEAYSLFAQKPKNTGPQNPTFIFSIKKLIACIKLGYYSDAEKTLQKNISIVSPGKMNWFLLHDLYILLAFHSKDWDKAYNIFEKYEPHPNLQNSSGFLVERWKINRAFLYYLILQKKLRPKDGQGKIRFRISTFLNNLPIYSKDKRGSNITILILHVLFLLQQEKYSAIIDRVESLKTYTHRYLRRDDTFRSNCFIKMLIQLPAANFHREAVVRKANPYWKKLLSVPLHKANQAAELEIIPYETLWEFVLDSLDNKFH